MHGYWLDPDRTTDSKITLGDAEWFMTGDNVEIDDDGYVSAGDSVHR